MGVEKADSFAECPSTHVFLIWKNTIKVFSVDTAKKVFHILGKKSYVDNKGYRNCNVDYLPQTILVKVLSR